MNVASNLPEPTYKVKRFLANIKNTKRLITSLFVLLKKVFML